LRRAKRRVGLLVTVSARDDQHPACLNLAAQNTMDKEARSALSEYYLSYLRIGLLETPNVDEISRPDRWQHTCARDPNAQKARLQ